MSLDRVRNKISLFFFFSKDNLSNKNGLFMSFSIYPCIRSHQLLHKIKKLTSAFAIGWKINIRLKCNFSRGHIPTLRYRFQIYFRFTRILFQYFTSVRKIRLSPPNLSTSAFTHSVLLSKMLSRQDSASLLGLYHRLAFLAASAASFAVK